MVEDCRIRPRVYKLRNGVPKAEWFVINLEYVFFFCTMAKVRQSE